MKIMVVGGGGREHALAWKLAQEAEVWVAPGNPGIGLSHPLVGVPAHDAAGLLQSAKALGVDLVVVGPEDPLILGLADELRAAGLAVVGPGRDGAQLEGSKALSKALMAEAGVPTAAFRAFTDPGEALDYARDRFANGGAVAVKASGNALGKGVVVCGSVEEAEDAIESMMVEKVFGTAADTVVIEDRLIGFEFSLLCVVSGESFVSLPVARDYKRALDGDRGPNTGGMGTFSTPEWPSADLVHRTEEEIIRPTLRALAARGIDYRGILFAGLMVQGGQPYCLEFNTRFGDPETQSVMRRLGDGFADLLQACALGGELAPIPVHDHSCVSIVLASAGYPGPYAKGAPIHVPALADGVEVFYAGVGEGMVTAGGRVLSVSATGENLAEARKKALEATESVEFEGKQYRRDIGLI